MIFTMLKAKIHRAAVTESNLHYVGSITIDRTLMEASGILEYEKVYRMRHEGHSTLDKLPFYNEYVQMRKNWKS